MNFYSATIITIMLLQSSHSWKFLNKLIREFLPGISNCQGILGHYIHMTPLMSQKTEDPSFNLRNYECIFKWNE